MQGIKDLTQQYARRWRRQDQRFTRRAAPEGRTL